MTSNSDQEQFLAACRSALESGTFKRAVFSSRSRSKEKHKIRFDLVLGGKKRLMKVSGTGGESEQFELDVCTLIDRMSAQPVSPFSSATLYSETSDLHYAENRKQEPRLYTSKASMKDSVQQHNRSKEYVLSQDRPYLAQLGVTGENDKVNKRHYPKFRQIANFIEIIDRDIGVFVETTERPISIVDLGCGKGYLTFATYDYVHSRAKLPPVGTGIDIKADVVDLCNRIAGNLEFTGLQFCNARIDPQRPEAVDILIALHACDTATDDALALGVRSNMQYFFCAPCCQAEIARQIKPASSSFDLINAYPLMKRRQADILTDTCRALLLTALGYEVKFLEFTALEHTSKNVMLAGKRSSTVDRQKAYSDYLELKKAAGFEHHSLEDNIRDLLEG